MPFRCFLPALLGALVLSSLAPVSAEEPASTSELSLAGGLGGTVYLVNAHESLCVFKPFAAALDWRHQYPKPVPSPERDGKFSYQIESKPPITGGLQIGASGTAVKAQWTFHAAEEARFSSLVVATSFGVSELAGRKWSADGKNGVFPETFGITRVLDGKAREFSFELPDKRVLKFVFAEPTTILIQDNRQWGDATFAIRFGYGGTSLAAGQTYTLGAEISVTGTLGYQGNLPDFLNPVELAAGEDWSPLRTELEIEPGSALDLSGMGFVEGPCGAKGRIISTPEGNFAAAGEPGKPLRFYGVNLSYSSNYLEKADCDRLLDRLVRLGYNTVRIHHHEKYLSSRKDGTGYDWDPVKVDQLDYLIAGCKKRGLWITTDLFVSRPISGAQIGRPETKVDMGTYKLLVLVSEPAYEDWRKFSRQFLDRKNPYTGVRLAEEPTIAWLSLVNEGPVSNNWGEAITLPEWKAAWNKWLAARFPTREALAAALPDLKPSEDPANGTVAMPATLSTKTPRGRLASVFIGEKETEIANRMRTFLQKDLNCHALLTNINNSAPDVIPLIGTRDTYDYVDEHFYVDHPHFLGKAWELPSYSKGENPIRSGAPGASAVASVRLWNKPFTISEYNFSGPGRFRGVGGILTAAQAALQDWDALWRFEYSYSKDVLFQPAEMGFFDLVMDPLNQAADRLATILYLRGDVATAPARLAMIVPRSALENPTDQMGLSAIQIAVWTAGVGSLVVEDQQADYPGFITIPIASGKEKDAVLAALREIHPQVTLPTPSLIRSQTGEITMLPEKGVLILDTPRSAGGYVEKGTTIEASRGGVAVEDVTTSASVFVSSLEKMPIKSASRLLVTHLTDLQNTGARYGEKSRQTLLAYGKLPHLVLNGTATVKIAFEKPETYTVWGLSLSGKREGKIPAKVSDGQLIFPVSVKSETGARMLYEVTNAASDGK